MAVLNGARNQIIDANPTPVFRLIGIAILGLVLVILFFNSVTRVSTPRAGVLTFFEPATGQILPEAMHLISPFKTDNELSIQMQTIKESANYVPASRSLGFAAFLQRAELNWRVDPDRPRKGGCRSDS